MKQTLLAQALVEYDYELDAYYSNASIFIDLDPEHNITDATDYNEVEIYTKLLLSSFSPNIMLFEASLHPMSIVGLYFRDSHEDIYDESQLDGFNVIKSVTAGYEEPYSVSFFIGRMMVFKNKEDDHIGKNRAYMGTLVTYGNMTIKDNVAHKDNWLTLEFKLKGTRALKNRDLDWSFRVGARVHDNKEFVNTLYVGARRSSVNYKKSAWSFVDNSAFSTMLAVNAETFSLTDAEAMVDKIWPLPWSEKMSFSLGIGYLFNSGEKYRGDLKEEGVNNHQLIFRPNIKF